MTMTVLSSVAEKPSKNWGWKMKWPHKKAMVMAMVVTAVETVAETAVVVLRKAREDAKDPAEVVEDDVLAVKLREETTILLTR
jgi:hypothetical protein